jgi:Immunoglobulin-like domain of bacterial spore germination
MTVMPEGYGWAGGLRALFKNREQMRLRLPILAAAAVLAAGCGSSSHGTVTTVATVTTNPHTVSAGAMTLTVFVVDHGLLRPKLARVRSTPAVAGAALGVLGIPAPVSIAGGTATVDLAKATPDQVAEIVYTLTQFPSVQRVDVAGRTSLTRDDFAAYLPPILIEAPAPGATVPQTFRVSGTASVFEATLVVQLVRDGKVLSKQTVTASEGAPGRGTFDETFSASPGALVVTAFAPSAADGTPQHQVDVPATVEP